MTKTTIRATQIEAGMVVEIYGSERFEVTRVELDEYGAVLIHNGIRWRGLGANETVTLLGRFNP